MVQSRCLVVTSVVLDIPSSSPSPLLSHAPSSLTAQPPSPLSALSNHHSTPSTSLTYPILASPISSLPHPHSSHLLCPASLPLPPPPPHVQLAPHAGTPVHRYGRLSTRPPCRANPLELRSSAGGGGALALGTVCLAAHHGRREVHVYMHVWRVGGGEHLMDQLHCSSVYCT